MITTEQRRALGAMAYRPLVIAHPFGTLSTEEVSQLANRIAKDIRSRLVQGEGDV
ncbi:hypothetical protein LLE49_12550 [Alicyclobacillus tolerans]|nr:hypothetical protein [Alicyclobacillus tolerans]